MSCYWGTWVAFTRCTTSKKVKIEIVSSVKTYIQNSKSMEVKVSHRAAQEEGKETPPFDERRIQSHL